MIVISCIILIITTVLALGYVLYLKKKNSFLLDVCQKYAGIIQELKKEEGE